MQSTSRGAQLESVKSTLILRKSPLKEKQLCKCKIKTYKLNTKSCSTAVNLLLCNDKCNITNLDQNVDQKSKSATTSRDNFWIGGNIKKFSEA